MRSSINLSFLLLFLILVQIAIALELPDNIQTIKEYNTEYFSQLSIPFAVAFLAGVLGVLSPCILPLLPAYFSYTFKEKRHITLMTFVFFLGFALVYIILGILAGFLGHQTLSMLQTPLVVRAAGVFILALGVLTLMGKSFYLPIAQNSGNDLPGVFLFGTLFGISWTGCLGPVLSGILGIGAILGNIWHSALLLFFYSLGIFLPLFLLSVFYDRWQPSTLQKEVTIAGRRIQLATLLSGSLFVLMGLFLVIMGDTTYFNSIDPLSTKLLFYDMQNWLLEVPWANTLAVAIFLASIIFLYINRKTILQKEQN